MKTTERPTLQNFHIDVVKHNKPIDVFEVVKYGKAVMLDVRELNEGMKEGISLDRGLNHPMSVIEDRLLYISKEQNIIVASPAGMRSVKVASLPIAYDFPNIASPESGLMTWEAIGLPFENSLSSCGCSCSAGIVVTPAFLSPSKSKSKDLDCKNLKLNI